MTSYFPEHYYGAVHDAYGRWTGQYDLVPWPEHLKPQPAEPLPDIDLPKLFNEAKPTVSGDPRSLPTLVDCGGVFFLTLSIHDRVGIATTIERPIGLLDAFDGDENLEDTADDEDGADAEPWLGWTADGPQALEKNAPQDDREDDGDDLEPSLGGPGHYTDVGMMYDLRKIGATMSRTTPTCLTLADRKWSRNAMRSHPIIRHGTMMEATMLARASKGKATKRASAEGWSKRSARITRAAKTPGLGHVCGGTGDTPMLTRRSILAGAPAAALLSNPSFALEKASPQAQIDFHWNELRKALAEHKAAHPGTGERLRVLTAMARFKLLATNYDLFRCVDSAGHRRELCYRLPAR